MNNKTIGILIAVVAVLAIAVYAIGLTRDNDTGAVRNNNNGRSGVEIAENMTSLKWKWERTVFEDGRVVEPREPAEFVLSFEPADRSFSSSTDCNSLFGTYEVERDGDLEFGDMGSTLMFCENALEPEYVEMLDEVDSYRLSEEGKLILEIGDGVMEFSRE